MSEDTTTQSGTFDEWGLVEIMGHQRYAGRIMEQSIGGSALLRVDVPESPGKPAFSKLFGISSIYAITPTTEEVARKLAGQMGRVEIERIGLPSPDRDRLDSPSWCEEY